MTPSRSLHTPGRRIAIAGSLAMMFPAAAARAQPAPDLWPRWARHDEATRAAIDHTAWSAFLARYAVAGADGVVRLPYGRIAADDRRALAAYVAALEAAPVSSLARAEQLAYWINFYNALTAKVVLDHYPVKSIRDIGLGGSVAATFLGGPWDAKLVRIEGEQVSLNDMEHRILRPIWRDARLHYGVNCASIGCPPLRAMAFGAASAWNLMDQAGSEYVNGPHGVRRQAATIWVSSIYRWFREDFGGTDTSVVAHLGRFATGDLAAALAAGVKIQGDFYDWKLNDLP